MAPKARNASPDLPQRIEAILFAGGKPLSLSEIAELLDERHRSAVQAALEELIAGYEGRASALELRKVGDRYALQLREAYVTVARPVTPLDMSARTLKALTLVAYHQPMLQSFLVRMIGDGAYEEVQRLRGMGFLHTEPKGSTLELTTTHLFAEHFGIGSTRPEEIRQYLEGKLGSKAATPVPGPEPTHGEPTPPSPEPTGEPPEAEVAPTPATLGAASAAPG